MTINSKDLGVSEGAELKDYIAAAKQFWENLKIELTTKPLYQPQLQDKPVRLSGVGWRKNKFGGANIKKWQLFSRLRSIIENSQKIRTENIVGEKIERGYIKSHWCEANVVLDGEPLRVGFTLLEDREGNLFYNLAADIKKEPFETRLPASQKRDPAKTLLQENIRANESDVNLEILGSANTEPRGSTTFYEDDHAVIRLFQSADASTAIHEMFHVFRREIERTAFEADSSAEATKRWKDVCDFVGADVQTYH